MALIVTAIDGKKHEAVETDIVSATGQNSIFVHRLRVKTPRGGFEDVMTSHCSRNANEPSLWIQAAHDDIVRALKASLSELDLSRYTST